MICYCGLSNYDLVCNTSLSCDQHFFSVNYSHLCSAFKNKLQFLYHCRFGEFSTRSSSETIFLNP